MPFTSRQAEFSRGFSGKAYPRDKQLATMPDTQNLTVTRDGTSLQPWPGFARTYPYPLLNGLSAWKHLTTGEVVYAATNPDSLLYSQAYGLRVVSVPPQALLLNAGRAVAVVDEVNGRIVALGYYAGGNPLRPGDEVADRTPQIHGRLFRLSKHEYPTMLFFDNKTFILSAWNEPKVYDGEVLRPLGLRAPQMPPSVVFGGDEFVLDADPTQWPNATYAGDTFENNPYVGMPANDGTALTEYAWKLPKDLASTYVRHAQFMELALKPSGKVQQAIRWNPAWGSGVETPVLGDEENAFKIFFDGSYSTYPNPGIAIDLAAYKITFYLNYTTLQKDNAIGTSGVVTVTADTLLTDLIATINASTNWSAERREAGVKLTWGQYGSNLARDMPAQIVTQTTGLGIPMATLRRQSGVTFRVYQPMCAKSTPILCQHNLAPKAMPSGSDHLLIPATTASIVLNVYLDSKLVSEDATKGFPANVLGLVLSATKIPVSGVSPYPVTSDITEDVVLTINKPIRRKQWTQIELAWPLSSDFQLRAVGFKKLKDLPTNRFRNLPNLFYADTSGTPVDWDPTGGASEFYIGPSGTSIPDFTAAAYKTAYCDLTFNLRYKTVIEDTSFLFEDDYLFCFSWKNSVTGQESAPSPLSDLIHLTAGMPALLNITGSLSAYFPTGHTNSAPDGADKICVYMHRSQWGTDETTQEPLLRLLGEYDIPSDEATIVLGTDRSEDEILLDRAPNYHAYSLPACGLGVIDGQRLLVAGQKDYAIGQVTVDSRSGYQIVTRVVGTPENTPQFGPWCEGRAIHIEGVEQDGLVVKACPAGDGDYYSLIVLNGAEFLAEDGDSVEQDTLDDTPRDYVIKSAPRRMWWSGLTVEHGVNIEGMALTNYLDLDVSPDGINHLGHIGGILAVTSRDKTLYMAQNMSALDDAPEATGVAFSASTVKPFAIGCMAGRTFQEVPGTNGSNYGAVWLTPDCGLAVANSDGIAFHPVSDVIRSFLRQADKVSQFELQHAFGHYNKADGNFYLFFFSPAGDLLSWSDSTPPDPFVNWGE